MMTYLFSYALITEAGFPLQKISLVLLAGPVGMLLGNRLLLPRLTHWPAKRIMLFSHVGFALSLTPILLTGSQFLVILGSLFCAFLLGSCYLPARSEYILAVKNAESGSHNFRASLRSWTYFATGFSALLSSLLLLLNPENLHMLVVLANVITRLASGALVFFLPPVAVKPHDEKPHDAPADDTDNASGTSGTAPPAESINIGRYTMISSSLVLFAALSGSFTFLVPLIFAQSHHAAGNHAEANYYPIILGIMTVLAGFLHRSKRLSEYVSQKFRNALITAGLGSGTAFLFLFLLLSSDRGVFLGLACLILLALTLANVTFTTLQWEYSYSRRHGGNTRRLEAIDNFAQTAISLAVPSVLTSALGLFSFTLFAGLGAFLLVGVFTIIMMMRTDS